MFKIVLLIILIILHFVMLSTMIVFERNNPRKLILWSVVLGLTSFAGGVVYAVIKALQNKKHKSLQLKINEDAIYRGLISNELYKTHVASSDEISSFACRAYNAKVTSKNSYDIINSFDKLDEVLARDVMAATKYVLFEANKINFKRFMKTFDAITEKAKGGLLVKFVYEKIIPLKYIRLLKKSGVKVYRYSRYNKISAIYMNLKNVAVIDGHVAYLTNFNAKVYKHKKSIVDSTASLKLKGEIAQEIDICLRQDIIYASGKYIEYSQPKRDLPTNITNMQYVCNDVENNLELLIVKAISQAKKSIQLELSEFVPTESIISLLKFALNSNIDVRLIVPFKTKNIVKNYATRAYAKELALVGADVYLYDGRILFNSIVIDGQCLLFGNYTMDRDFLTNSTQDILISQDEKLIDLFNKKFDGSIDNSYRINNAKYMLCKEKLFKNLV